MIFIAEIGLNHNGNLDLCHELIRQAKWAGADTAKFQLGWRAKKDEIKQFQLVLYKKFFSQQYNIPIEDIDIEFFIVKRKIWEDTEYPMSRIQQFIPASGKTKLNKASKLLDTFISEVFSLDGSYKDTIFNANPSKWNCTFCPYKENKELCSAVGKSL